MSDTLTNPDAGPRAIRGGLLRVAGYALGLLLTALSSVLLLRYLGVIEFGRFVTVTALVAVVSSLTEAGLTVVGQREFVQRRTDEERRVLLGDLLGLRMAITPAAILLATAFAWVAGYPDTLVLGTAVAGAGVVFINAAAALMVPLAVALRFGAVTAIELARQVVIVAGVVLLVILTAELGAFFAVYLVAGAAGAVMALALVDPADRVRPTVHWERWKVLLRETAPIAVGLVANAIYIRALIIALSLLSTEFQTGLFGASSRVLEVFIGIPAMMAGAAFPILVHASAVDETRLAYALQRLVEASLLVAILLVLCLTFAAEPVIAVLGGAEFEDAAPVLRIQALALVGAFLAQVWILALVAVRKPIALLVMNAVALVAVAVAAAILLPPHGAIGAAWAAVLGETTLAVVAGVLLVRTRPALRPDLRVPLRIVAAGGVAAGIALLAGLPPVLGAVLASVAFVAVAFALGAVPKELLAAFVHLRRSRSA